MTNIEYSKQSFNPFRKDLLLSGLLVFFLAQGLYINTVWNGYVLDDIAVIQTNTITSKGLAGLPQIFTTSYWYGFNGSTDLGYRPLSLASFAIENSISPNNTYLSHAVQVFIFAISCWILFLTLALLLPVKSLFIPLITTLLFVVHPIHTEVVANLKSRDELFSFLFLILSVYFIAKHIHISKKPALYLAGAFFLFALMSKENSATFIAIVPLLVYFFSAKPWNENLRVSGFIAGVFVFYMIGRTMLLGEISVRLQLPLMDNSLVAAPDIFTRLSAAISILGRYLLLLVFPHPLSSDYSYSQIPLEGWFHWSTLLSLGIHVFLAGFAIKNFRSKNLLAFSILFYAISFALTCNLFFLVGATMAERFLYTPSLGFCLAMAVLAEKYCTTPGEGSFFSIPRFIRGNIPVVIVFSLLFALFSFKTVTRNVHWKSNFSLFSQDLKTSPRSGRLHYFMGTTLLDRYNHEPDIILLKRLAMLADAEREYKKALAIYPAYSEAHMGMGLSFYYRKKYNQAVACYRQALFYDTTSSATLNNLGNVLVDLGDYQGAILVYGKAIRIKPGDPEFYNNMGQAFLKTKAYPDAIKVTEKALEIDPAYLLGWCNLGRIYFADKQYDKAIEKLKKALALSPDNPDVLYLLSYTYSRKGDREQGVFYLEKAKKFNPRIEEHFQ